ncbi:MAG: hypothetical protein IJ240_05175 [Clostridia bacterium]|nr:hypothetical protein [Clostridia bacterium]
MKSMPGQEQSALICSVIDSEKVLWRDVRQAPFMLHGFYHPQSEPYFHRMPEETAATVSTEVLQLQRQSTGGRVRFSTDSPYIAIRAKYRFVERDTRGMPLVATAGFDLYEDGPFGNLFIRGSNICIDDNDCYEQLLRLMRSGLRTYTINFPILSEIQTLEIGLAPQAKLEAPRPYRAFLPVVFYGSSITHGKAASRPGLIYEAEISRMLNIDYINLGFSGFALAEQAMARYIGSLPMSVFVCDYDHNSPSSKYLNETHWPMYETFRAAQPDTPYIMITRPNYYTAEDASGEVMARRDVVMRSYLRAREAGDKNVYFIDCTAFFADEQLYSCTQDPVHPSEIGFMHMAKVIGTVLRRILEERSADGMVE